jgi:hypothetical protein
MFAYDLSAMIYQMPNGRILNISIEEFLSMSDEELGYLDSIDCGESITSPWYGSTLKSPIRSFEHKDFESLKDDDNDLNIKPEELFDDMDDLSDLFPTE